MQMRSGVLLAVARLLSFHALSVLLAPCSRITVIEKQSRKNYEFLELERAHIPRLMSSWYGLERG